MQTYTLKYRRWLFKRTIKNVVGHSYVEQTDKLWIRTCDGGCEIKNWSKCEIFLGADWLAAYEDSEKRKLEQLTKVKQAS